jgi:hypothetical protein
MITFKSNDIKIDKLRYPKMLVSHIEAFNVLTDQPGIEAAGANAENISIHPSNGFKRACELAYTRHLPLTLKPDDIWLCISQGLSTHINNNAETLRYQFVKHKGQELISIHEDSFIKGSPTNNWQATFGKFSAAIKEYIGKKHDLIVANFTTTGIIEKAASELVLMEAMQAYFKYQVKTLCGIPEITLLGETDDWKNIRQRVETFAEFGLEWWVPSLFFVIDHFIAASQNNIDKDFWNRLYKMNGGSGGTSIAGWINVLFPYLDNGRKNTLAIWNPEKPSYFGGTQDDNFPLGLSRVPFEWLYYEEKYEMEFLAGFTGAHIDEKTGGISPAMGWAVRDKTAVKGTMTIKDKVKILAEAL